MLSFSLPKKKKENGTETGKQWAFLAWVDFHARSRFARSTIPEEKWGTTRSLFKYLPRNTLRTKEEKKGGKEGGVLITFHGK